ncbi:BlaI/MecI/CopY family transcriptional regulator [Nonomuraea sp. CA-141351]|uniref:BlaI/MecI/CopY family transcriptional regulator n=1 Tax=Nonomuraea sp. CA-141351 TaxID=3239996 RepID=UPI003D8FB063
MADPSRERRDRGALEAQVLTVIAASDHPMTPGEVVTLLADGLAYTTVMTVLARLYRKGALSRVRHGRAFAYTFVRDEDARRALRMREMLEKGNDKASVLAHFVGELSAEDEATLQQLLRQASRPDGSAEGPPEGGA